MDTPFSSWGLSSLSSRAPPKLGVGQDTRGQGPPAIWAGPHRSLHLRLNCFHICWVYSAHVQASVSPGQKSGPPSPHTTVTVWGSLTGRTRPVAPTPPPPCPQVPRPTPAGLSSAPQASMPPALWPWQCLRDRTLLRPAGRPARGKASGARCDLSGSCASSAPWAHEEAAGHAGRVSFRPASARCPCCRWGFEQKVIFLCGSHVHCEN